MSKVVPFNPAVPTTTLIIAKKGEPNMVIAFDSSGKHGNKKVIPGGRVQVGQQSWLDTGMREAEEEVNITDLSEVQVFTLCSKPGRDVRRVTLEKYLDGAPVPDGIDPEKVQIDAHYGFDVVLMATTEGEPVEDGVETNNAYFIDVHGVDPDEFALDHGHLLVAYAKYLKTGKLPELGDF